MKHDKETRSERLKKLGGFKVVGSSALCIIFRRCYISNRVLFLRKAVKMKRHISGPGFPVILTCWVDKKELLFLELSGTLEQTPYDPLD